MSYNNRFLICISLLIIVLIFVAMGLIGDAKEEEWESKYMTVEATGYCPCEKCCQQYSKDKKTAIGRDAELPGIAVDPSVIPHRARIDCSEYDRKPIWCISDDSGSAIKGNKIDLRFESHDKAKTFGKKEIKIRVWTKK